MLVLSVIQSLTVVEYEINDIILYCLYYNHTIFLLLGITYWEEMNITIILPE